MNNVTIYTLSDPITGEVRYVGKTIQKLKYRLATHICRNRNNKNHTEAWVKSLLKKDLKPVIEELCIVDESMWEDEEKFYISYFRYIGFRLTNHSEGGDASNLGSRWKWSEKVRINNNKRITTIDKRLKLYNIDGSFIWDIRNFTELSFILGVSYKEVYTAYIKKCLIRNSFYILPEASDVKTVIANKKVKRIKYTDIITGKSFIFLNAKEAQKHLNIDNSTILKSIKNNKFVNKTKKFETC